MGNIAIIRLNRLLDIVIDSTSEDRFDYSHTRFLGYLDACQDLGFVDLPTSEYYRNAVFDLVFLGDHVCRTNHYFTNDLNLINDNYLNLHIESFD